LKALVWPQRRLYKIGDKPFGIAEDSAAAIVSRVILPGLPGQIADLEEGAALFLSAQG
jgi:hypothetical protein